MSLQDLEFKITRKAVLMSVLGELPFLIHLRKMAQMLEHFSFCKVQHAELLQVSKPGF